MILVLGGTSDSIHICNKLNDMGLAYIVSVTTEYGRDIAKKATENVFLGKLTKEEIERFKTGLKIEDYTTAPAKLKVIKYDEQRDSSLLEIKIHEGKNRQVRKMCKAINHPVLRLRRSAMGKIKIGDCEIGKYRYLTEDEIKYLKNL